MSQLLSFLSLSLALRLPQRLAHGAADAVARGTTVPETLVFPTPRIFFVFSGSLFSFSPTLPPPHHLSAYHLSAFLSKDIYQRNIAPASLVTPTALCQLSETERTLTSGRHRAAVSVSALRQQTGETSHIYVSLKTPTALLDQ